jgi:hypothetical protein
MLRDIVAIQRAQRVVGLHFADAPMTVFFTLLDLKLSPVFFAVHRRRPFSLLGAVITFAPTFDWLHVVGANCGDVLFALYDADRIGEGQNFAAAAIVADIVVVFAHGDVWCGLLGRC